MKVFGFRVGDLTGQDCEVWPDNWPAFIVFEAMYTQWRVGACGATGLDYGVLPSVIRMCGVPAGSRQSIFSDIRQMEAEALAVMAEQRDNK
ncbi:hypothetical protein BK640_29240 [Pseudomonas protegens]|nr:hypothetical protein BK639_28200 [Pseudomonas protegens]ROL95376.1 hypothetical protein BK640_29240 [Pseudomonas protegens]ROL98457.1 hypothetical protein BK641_26865 [Pseudomonas protegens]ROM08286.1 hypothetical protein BK642_13765 [Pseudomonas protegens]